MNNDYNISRSKSPAAPKNVTAIFLFFYLYRSIWFSIANLNRVLEENRLFLLIEGRHHLTHFAIDFDKPGKVILLTIQLFFLEMSTFE